MLFGHRIHLTNSSYQIHQTPDTISTCGFWAGFASSNCSGYRTAQYDTFFSGIAVRADVHLSLASITHSLSCSNTDQSPAASKIVTQNSALIVPENLSSAFARRRVINAICHFEGGRLNTDLRVLTILPTLWSRDF
ncbi:hypothetical protein ST47_g7364 [Ascochyta rabiei]|uniref:Uncharacterized protein n=1 Tax=Didymella rabiei TaxID=5454 RepID=A0A163AXS9_DIDRA|nr:hypothetical protein ST47_g7364 [Ascochyta rabiei]